MMDEHRKEPPVCIQIISIFVAVSFGIYCILKGATFGAFTWWYIAGIWCIICGAFATIRVYEVCITVARQETALELNSLP